jgi:hypothetical protein
MNPKYLKKIAADALAQLKAGKLRPAHNFLTPGFDDFNHQAWRDFHEGVTPISEVVATTCAVCAKGALLVAHFMNAKEGDTVGQVFHRMNELSAIVGDEQFSEIERCFEGWGELGGAYASTYRYDGNRLRAILENIVRNEGHFDPAQDIPVPA